MSMPKMPGLGGIPLIPRTGLLPMRVTPLLIPRLSNYAARVMAKVKAHGTVPAATLVNKLISGTISPEGDYHEYYALMRNGDPEAFMDIMLTVNGEVWGGVSRMCAAACDVYLDDALKATFPETVGDGPWIGFTGFQFATE